MECRINNVFNKPVLDKPVLDKPVLNKQVLDKQVLDKQVLDKPVLNKPVLDKPILDKPGVNVYYKKHIQMCMDIALFNGHFGNRRGLLYRGFHCSEVATHA